MSRTRLVGGATVGSDAPFELLRREASYYQTSERPCAPVELHRRSIRMIVPGALSRSRGASSASRLLVTARVGTFAAPTRRRGSPTWQLPLGTRPAAAAHVSSAAAAAPPSVPPCMYTRTHEVLRPESIDEEGSVTMTVGLTPRALDLIGDVKAIDRVVDPGARVGAGGNLASLHWEGFRRTASDELYHAVWSNVSSRRPLALPFAASVVGFNGAAVADPYKTVTADAGGWVLRVTASRAALEAAARDEGALMCAGEYAEMCEREEEEEEAAASRSYP